MNRRARKIRHAMAVTHARKLDNRHEAETGVRAGDRRKALKVQRRAVRRAALDGHDAG